MPRTLGTSFRNSIESQANTELILVFGIVTHPQLGVPIRVVTEDIGGISYANGKIVNYNYNGDLYLGLPFSCTLLTDDDNPPKATLTIPNVDRRIGEAVLGLTSSPRFQMILMKASDWNLGVYDSNNAVSPIGTPEIEYNAKYLYLRNIQGDEATITADIITFDIANEPCPAIRTTQDRCPGLYR